MEVWKVDESMTQLPRAGDLRVWWAWVDALFLFGMYQNGRRATLTFARPIAVPSAVGRVVSCISGDRSGTERYGDKTGEVP